MITRSAYTQMCGRAGRAGLEVAGESITVIKAEDVEQFVSKVRICPSSFERLVNI